MKRLNLLFAMMALMMLLATSAWAAPKVTGVVPCMEGDEVILPSLPAGATLVKVVIYNDEKMTPARPIGAKHRFPLACGEGFNFVFQDKEGYWWNGINEKSKVGAGLALDPWQNPNTGRIEYKYIRNCTDIPSGYHGGVDADPHHGARHSNPGAVATPPATSPY